MIVLEAHERRVLHRLQRIQELVATENVGDGAGRGDLGVFQSLQSGFDLAAAPCWMTAAKIANQLLDLSGGFARRAHRTPRMIRKGGQVILIAGLGASDPLVSRLSADAKTLTQLLNIAGGLCRQRDKFL